MYMSDLLYIAIFIAMLGSMWASAKVRNTFEKYANVFSSSGLTARQVAHALLEQNGITDVAIDLVEGNLTDHYNPKDNTVYLSETVYESSSVSALGVAAHEIGHVLQHYESYAPLQMRSFFLPAAQLGSQAAIPLFFLGMVMSIDPLITIGIVIFIFVVLFYLVTLPVEFNASKRAITALVSGGYITEQEAPMTKKVLSAAGLTYVMAAIQAVLQLLRLLVMSSGKRRKR